VAGKPVQRARCAVSKRRVNARPIDVVTGVFDAGVAVVAFDAFAKVLSAHPVHADALELAGGAWHSIRLVRRVDARPIDVIAGIIGARVLVIARNAFAEVLSAQAI